MRRGHRWSRALDDLLADLGTGEPCDGTHHRGQPCDYWATCSGNSRSYAEHRAARAGVAA
jgi:hypothetical protein